MQIWSQKEKQELAVQNQYLYLTSSNMYSMRRLIEQYVKKNGLGSYKPIFDTMINLEDCAKRGSFSGTDLIHLTNDDKILGESLNARPFYDIKGVLGKVEDDVKLGEEDVIRQRKNIELEYINGKKAVAYTKRKQQEQKTQQINEAPNQSQANSRYNK